MNQNIEAKKIDALLEMGLELIEERSRAIAEIDVDRQITVVQANNVLKSTESLLTLIILAIDGRGR